MPGGMSPSPPCEIAPRKDGCGSVVLGQIQERWVWFCGPGADTGKNTGQIRLPPCLVSALCSYLPKHSCSHNTPPCTGGLPFRTNGGLPCRYLGGLAVANKLSESCSTRGCWLTASLRGLAAPLQRNPEIRQHGNTATRQYGIVPSRIAQR